MTSSPRPVPKLSVIFFVLRLPRVPPSEPLPPPEPPDPPDPQICFFSGESYAPPPLSAFSSSFHGSLVFSFRYPFTAVCSLFHVTSNAPFSLCRSYLLRFTALLRGLVLSHDIIVALSHSLTAVCRICPSLVLAISFTRFNSGFLCYVPTICLSCLICRLDNGIVSLMTIMVFAPIQNFVFLGSITAVCSLFVFNPAFGAVILVFLSWWQIERNLRNTSPTRNLVMMGICCPGSSYTEQVLFPKFPPLWSGLDVQASLVFQGFSSQLMVFSAFDADSVTSQVTVDAIIQETTEIVLIGRFPLCYSYDLYSLPIYLSIKCYVVGSAFVVCFYVWHVVVPPRKVS